MVVQPSSPHPLNDSSECLIPPTCLLQLTNPDGAGLLDKRSNLSGWYTYHFSLKGSQLHYFELTPTPHRGLLAGTISLFRHKLTPFNTPKRRYELEILDSSNKLHILRATTDVQWQKWASLFQRARNKIPPPQPFPTPPSPSRPHPTPLTAPHTLVDSHLPVHHLLCVVHGIGVSEAQLGANMRSLHESYTEVMSRVYPDLNFRVEFMFIHWRAALTSLDIHKKLQSVVPVPPHPTDPNPLREFMVHRIVDYVYYTHARYRRHILRAISDQLNAQVKMFRERRPDFEGKISVLGHSLGAALCYDLMCRRVVDDQTLLEAEGMRLEFEAVNLFCLGNPLGTLMMLDPTIGMGAEMRDMPFRLYNVFKYHDPIATRLEPVIDGGLVREMPVTVPCWFNMGMRETTTQWLGGLWSGGGKKKEEGEDDLAGEGRRMANGSGKQGRSRVDFGLQASSTMEDVSTSWSALRAHTEYWGNRDAMLFLVSRMVKSEVGEWKGGKKGVWVEGGDGRETGVDDVEGVVREVVGQVVEEAVRRFEGRKSGSGGWAEYLAMVGLGDNKQ
eukprot:GFKZ01008317.1.p1 GENE.GFKZ01008317.1~~GFKZ01008317.1.p1  ORF type:complete len:557 (+),score=70.00 GFKZ01008317.1:77-1747(+)